MWVNAMLFIFLRPCCPNTKLVMAYFQHPYEYDPAYSKRVAYFCMEYGIDQALKTFSGGLGYLAGSHMRSAYDLRQNFIGVGILWKYGYYDQVRKRDQGMDVLFLERYYNYLEDTGILFDISVDKHPVKVKAWHLPPGTFGTVPMYFLSTDLPENDYLAQTICHRLYDSDSAAKIAQYILLGQGGIKLLEKLDYHPDRIHLNEAHGLPAAFYEYYTHKSLEKLQEKFVFTTHTPVPAGNETHDIKFLKKMGFFHDTPLDEIRTLTGIKSDGFNLTLGALRVAGRANGVSKMHGEVARQMWSSHDDICPIDHVTNAQHQGYWTDEKIRARSNAGDLDGLAARKRTLKSRLLAEVANQTGKILDPDVLTMVWARRFAAYKRADLLTWDDEAFNRLLSNQDLPIQIIWAGKPYPMDYGAISTFNKLVEISRKHPNIAVLVNYELALSKLLKQGADVWLNTPRVTREASGTSGMTAAMNAAINFSTYDGWIPEYAQEHVNAYIIPKADLTQSIEDQDQADLQHSYRLLREEILPSYYHDKGRWRQMMQHNVQRISDYFESGRMAKEYYEKIYR